MRCERNIPRLFVLLFSLWTLKNTYLCYGLVDTQHKWELAMNCKSRNPRVRFHSQCQLSLVEMGMVEAVLVCADERALFKTDGINLKSQIISSIDGTFKIVKNICWYYVIAKGRDQRQ